MPGTSTPGTAVHTADGRPPMSTSETRTDTPAARVPAPRRADRGERWTERLGWEESPVRESRVSRG